MNLPTPSNVVDIQTPDEMNRSKHVTVPKPIAVVPKDIESNPEVYNNQQQVVEYAAPRVLPQSIQQSNFRYIQARNPHPSTITMRPSPVAQNEQAQQQPILTTAATPPRRIIQPGMRPLQQMPVTPIQGRPQQPPPTYAVLSRSAPSPSQVRPRLVQQVQPNHYPQGQPIKTMIASPQAVPAGNKVITNPYTYSNSPQIMSVQRPTVQGSPVAQVVQPQVVPRPVQVASSSQPKLVQQTPSQPQLIQQAPSQPQLVQQAPSQPQLVQQDPSQPQIVQQAPSQGDL